jgi:hypothetical protein
LRFTGSPSGFLEGMTKVIVDSDRDSRLLLRGCWIMGGVIAQKPLGSSYYVLNTAVPIHRHNVGLFPINFLSHTQSEKLSTRLKRLIRDLGMQPTTGQSV